MRFLLCKAKHSSNDVFCRVFSLRYPGTQPGYVGSCSGKCLGIVLNLVVLGHVQVNAWVPPEYGWYTHPLKRFY